MALLASSSLHSFPSTARDAVGSSPASARTEHFLHITGEVTNPVLLENFTVEHPMVHSAIMFGHGRYSAGLLIELADKYKIDTNDAEQVEETRNKLQPVVDRMNMFAPQHARVQKEMILFASALKPFTYAPLSNVRVKRRETLEAYNDEINTLYKTIAGASQIELKPPKIWSPNNSLAYIRGIIAAVLGTKLDDNTDFFDHGIDSLQATRIRIILFHALRTSAKLDSRKLSGNVVYQYRTIASLATFASRTALANFRQRTESSLARCLEMTEMVQTHSQDFPEHTPVMSPPTEDVVLITGTTGLFGSNLLARFLDSQTVAKVYALNRRKSRPGSVVERQASSFQAFGLDPALARHPKLVLLEADASRSQLGLAQELYEQLLSSVTHIVHNAWLTTYDDTLPLSIFDNSFRTLRNLVDFALVSPLSSPPRLLFISSTDTVRGASDTIPRSTSASDKDGPASACNAAGGAYGESKWVGEQILLAASAATPLRPISFRLGPLCSAPNGRWRDDAHLPTIVHLGSALGALPDIDETVHWIPAHTAAQAILELRNASQTHVPIVHPSPVPSLSLLQHTSFALGLPLVPLAEWTARLEERVHAVPPPAAVAARLDDPALMLLRHLERAEDPTAVIAPDDAGTRVFERVRVVDDEAWVASPTLSGGVDPLGGADVALWLGYWREACMIPDE